MQRDISFCCVVHHPTLTNEQLRTQEMSEVCLSLREAMRVPSLTKQAHSRSLTPNDMVT